MEVKKNDCRYPIPSQPVTKHSHIPLVHKRSAGEVVVAAFEKTVFFSIPHTKFVPAKNTKMEVKKNDC